MNPLFFILLFYVLPGLLLWIITLILFKIGSNYDEKFAKQMLIAIFLPLANLITFIGITTALIIVLLSYFYDKTKLSKKKFNTKKFFLVK